MAADAIRGFDGAFLDSLSARAAASPRLREHHNIHQSYDDPCQRFWNALEPGTYLQPSRHALVPKGKLLVALRGGFVALLFDDSGNVTAVVPFIANATEDAAVAVEVAPHTWNTVLCREPGSILLEVKAGPFDPAAPRESAPWAPRESTAEAAIYLAQLERIASTWPGGQAGSIHA